jgi:hypothetical protein
MDMYKQCIVLVRGYTLAGAANSCVEWPVVIGFTVKLRASNVYQCQDIVFPLHNRPVEI